MIYSIIPFKAQDDKVNEVKKLYRSFFQKLRKKHSPVDRYEVYQAKDDPTQFFTFKAFKSRKDEKVHHSDPELLNFVGQLDKLCEIKTAYHEVKLSVDK